MAILAIMLTHGYIRSVPAKVLFPFQYLHMDSLMTPNLLAISVVLVFLAAAASTRSIRLLTKL